MKLSDFTIGLFEKGDVTVAGHLMEFERQDLQTAAFYLRDFYRMDLLNLPGEAPEFYPPAAVWGAKYIYYAIQFTLMRDLGEELLAEYFPEFPRTVTPKAVYSVDLTFRYLPDLFRLAKGLAPDDPLVKMMRKTAMDWPFSSIGMAASTFPEDWQPDLSPIQEHPALWGGYIDRVIEKRDKKRLEHPEVYEAVAAALGDHSGLLWPAFKEIKPVPYEN